MRRLGWAVVVLAAMAGLPAACGGENTSVPMTTSMAEALDRVNETIMFVEDPIIDFNVYTTSLGAFQLILLEGSLETVEGEAVPGLTEARDALANGDQDASCTMAAATIRGSLVNRVMDFSALDAVQLTDDDRQLHDPNDLFLGRPDALRIMGNGRELPRSVVGVEGDVVSELWKDVTLDLMDIIYGLGQECVDAAKEA